MAGPVLLCVYCLLVASSAGSVLHEPRVTKLAAGLSLSSVCCSVLVQCSGAYCLLTATRPWTLVHSLAHSPFPKGFNKQIVLVPEATTVCVTVQIPPNSKPSVFDAIYEAFEAVWRILTARMAHDSGQSREMKIALSRTLVGLVADGVTDPRELRCEALDRMALHAD